MWRSPLTTAAFLLTFALGIGASTGVFSLVFATLLKPLPYVQAGRIYCVEVSLPERRNQTSNVPVRIQDYLDWRNAETAFSSMAALRPGERTLTGDGEKRVAGGSVSWNFFEFLGVPPARGRGFTRESRGRTESS